MTRGFALRLIKHGQEFRAAQEYQGSDRTHRVHAHNRNEGHTEGHHQRCMRLANPAEQSVKNPEQINKFDCANHFAGDAETEKPLGSEDVVRGRRRVSRYEQLGWNIDDAEETRQGVHQVQHACDPRCFFWLSSQLPS